MKWIKKGLVYGPDGTVQWAKHSALTPTPFLMDEQTIRVYAGFRDEEGISRIGYVDVDASDPSYVKAVSQRPVLDVGKPGTFDDNGVILGDVIRFENEVRMYYVGFQLVKRAKFLAFSGLAISRDGGETFARYADSPIMDRSPDGLYIRAIHSVMKDGDTYRAWYAKGNGWQEIKGILYPQYEIWGIESSDGINFSGEGELCIPATDIEYRIGRPRVFQAPHGYVMHYTSGTVDGVSYMAGYAESTDGRRWHRKDGALGIALSSEGWDSRHLCYPAVIAAGGKTYMFYNGNDMGQSGFGYAVLAED